MSSKVSIVNQALTHLGVTKYIANFDTERTTEAIVARQTYDIARASTLRDFDWPFARAFASPGLVSTDASDRRRWNNAYRYPSDCVKIRRIMPDTTQWSNEHIIRPAYEIASDSQGRLILTNESDIRIAYTKDETDTGYFDISFTLALSYKLAYLMAPGLTGGDPFKLQDRMVSFYNNAITDAHFHANNEEQPINASDDDVSEFTGARS